MNTIAIPANVNRFLKLEDAPAPGSGTMPASQERNFAVLAILFPLIVWPWKRKASPVVDVHGKEALNMAISLMLVMFPLGFIGGLLGTAATMLVSLVTSLMSFAMLGVTIFACVKAQQGNVLRYPFILRFIK